jgi:hypothetical protein
VLFDTHASSAFVANNAPHSAQRDGGKIYENFSSIKLHLPFFDSRLVFPPNFKHASRALCVGHCKSQCFAYAHAFSTGLLEFDSPRTIDSHLNVHSTPADEYTASYA